MCQGTGNISHCSDWAADLTAGKSVFEEDCLVENDGV
jgi:hypothetical protein